MYLAGFSKEHCEKVFATYDHARAWLAKQWSLLKNLSRAEVFGEV